MTLSVRTTIVTGGALLALWILSWAVSYADLGTWSLVIALVIAAAKAILVALFFMELIVEKASFNLAILSAMLLISFLVSFVLADVATRVHLRAPSHVEYPTERM
jgi:cytochrome c oxidase subunit IV